MADSTFPPLDPGPDADDPVYVISVAAELANMHPQTLRAYERKGLLTPARTGGGTRRYSRRDVELLKFVQHLTQEEGLNLAGVRIVLQLGEQLEVARRRVNDLEDAVRSMAQRLKEDVDAAHASHRFEMVPSPARNVEPHPRYGRPTRRRPAGPPASRTAGRKASPSAQKARPVLPPGSGSDAVGGSMPEPMPDTT